MWKESIIINFNDNYVFAECIVDCPLKGKILKIPIENVRPQEWIALNQHIWCVEHNIWNFVKMFDKKNYEI